MNGGFLVNMLAAICITHRVSLQTEPTQLNISTPTNSTIGNTAQFYVGKTTVSSGKIISNNASDGESIMFSTPKTNAQECCKTTQSSDSETSQPASTFSEGNSSFSRQTPAPAETENISGTTPSNALQTSGIIGGNIPAGISSPLAQSETSVRTPTQGFLESQINELLTTLTDMPGNIQTNMKPTKMSTQSHTDRKESDATKSTTLLTTINTVVTRNTQSGQKTSSEASSDYKAPTNFTVVPGTTEPTSINRLDSEPSQNQSTDSLKTDSASTQSSAGTTKPEMSTTETQMKSTEPATLRALKTETSTAHYTQTQIMEDMTTPLSPLLETSATGTTRKSTSSRPPVTRATRSELQTSMKNNVRSFTTHFQNTSEQITVNVTTETQTAVAEASETAAQGLETSTTSESLTTQLPKTSKQTAASIMDYTSTLTAKSTTSFSTISPPSVISTKETSVKGLSLPQSITTPSTTDIVEPTTNKQGNETTKLKNTSEQNTSDVTTQTPAANNTKASSTTKISTVSGTDLLSSSPLNATQTLTEAIQPESQNKTATSTTTKQENTTASAKFSTQSTTAKQTVGSVTIQGKTDRESVSVSTRLTTQTAGPLQIVGSTGQTKSMATRTQTSTKDNTSTLFMKFTTISLISPPSVTSQGSFTTQQPTTTMQTNPSTTNSRTTDNKSVFASTRLNTQTAQSVEINPTTKQTQSSPMVTVSKTSIQMVESMSTASTQTSPPSLTSTMNKPIQSTQSTPYVTRSTVSTVPLTTTKQDEETSKLQSISNEATASQTIGQRTTRAFSTTRSYIQEKTASFKTRESEVSSTSEASTIQILTAEQTAGLTTIQGNTDSASVFMSTRPRLQTAKASETDQIATQSGSSSTTAKAHTSTTNTTSLKTVGSTATPSSSMTTLDVTAKNKTVAAEITKTPTIRESSTASEPATGPTPNGSVDVQTSKKSDKISSVSTQSTSAQNPLHVTTETQTAAAETGSSTAFKQTVSSTYSESVSDHNRSVSELLQTLTQNTYKTTQSQNEPTTTPQPLITGSTRIQENTNSGSDSFSTIDRKQTIKTMETVPTATQTDSRSPTIIKKISTTTAKQPAGSVTQTSTESGSIPVSAKLSTHSTQPAASKILNISATIDLSYITETLTVAKQTMADQNESSQTVNESLQSSTLKSKTQDRPSLSAADNSGSSTSAAFPTEQYKAIGSTTVQTNTKSESILMSTRLNTQMAADVQTETSSVSKSETQASTTNTDTSTQMVMSKATTAKQITTTTTIRGKDVSGLVSMSPETGTTSLSVISSTSVTRQFTKLSNATQTTTKTDKGMSLKTPEPITLNLTPTSQTRAAEITKTTEFETLHEMESTSIALTAHQPTATKHATGSATGQVTTYGGSVPMSTKQTVGSGTILLAATQTLSILSTNATSKSTTDHETTNIMESMLTQGGLVSGQNGGESMESMATGSSTISPTSLTSTGRTSVKATSLTPSMTIKPTTNTVEKAQLQNTSEKITLNVKGEAQTTNEQMTKTPAKIESFTTSKETKGPTKGGLVVTQTQTINTVYGQQQISTQIPTLRTPAVNSQETSSSAVTKSEKPTTSAPLTTQQTAGTTTTNRNTDSRLDSVSSRPTTQTAESDKHANSNSITTSASSATSTTGANGKSTVSTLSVSIRLTSSVVANTQEETENTKLPAFPRQSTQNVTTKIQTPEKETSITPETTKADTQDETKTLAEKTTEASSTTRSENQQKMSLFTTRKSSTSEASTTQPSTAKQTVGSTMTEANKDRGSLTASTRQTVTTRRIVTITESNPSTTANQASITNQTSTSMVNVKATGLMTTSSTSVTSKTEGTVQLTSSPPPLTTRSTTGTEAEIPTSKKSDKISSTQSTSAQSPLHVTTETQTAAAETGSSTAFKQAVVSTYSESVSDHNRNKSTSLPTSSQKTGETNESEDQTKDASPATNKSEIPKTQQPPIIGSITVQENTKSKSISLSTFDRRQTEHNGTQTNYTPPTTINQMSITTAKQPVGSTTTQGSVDSGSIYMSAKKSSITPATTKSNTQDKATSSATTKSQTTTTAAITGKQPTTTKQTVSSATTVSSRTSTITAHAVTNTNYDTSLTTGQVSPTASTQSIGLSNQSPTQVIEKTTGKQEAGRTTGHMGTTVNTTPHTTASLVTSPQETTQTAAHTITPEEEPETASAAWTADQYSSTLRSLESSSSQQPQSVSLVPVSTSRSTSASVPAQSSSHSTTEEAHSSTSPQVNGTTNMEKATVKSTAAEYGSADTTDSNLYTSSANIRHANTTQLEYDASPLPVSRNRTVFFKYSPRIVIVKPLVFDYPVVERITFLSNDTDKIDGMTN